MKLCYIGLTARALVAYNGGTSGGHGVVTILFLEPDFGFSASALNVRHGPFQNSFLGPDFVSLTLDTLSNYVILAPYQCLGGL